MISPLTATFKADALVPKDGPSKGDSYVEYQTTHIDNTDSCFLRDSLAKTLCTLVFLRVLVVITLRGNKKRKAD